MEELEARRLRLVAEQSGLLSRSQAVDLGMTVGGIRAQVDAGRWERRNRGVVSTTTGLLSDRGQLHAVLLALRSTAALSHQSSTSRSPHRAPHEP